MTHADRYDKPAIYLHWLIAIVLIGLMALGYYMGGLPKNTPERAYFFSLHKSFGLLALVLAAIRLGWRVTHPVPPLPASMPDWEIRASAASHQLLYLFMLLQPISGYISSSFNKYGVKFFGLPLPNWGWEDKGLRELFAGAHNFIAVIFVVAIAVHVLAALRHRLIDKDNVFQRMLP